MDKHKLFDAEYNFLSIFWALKSINTIYNESMRNNMLMFHCWPLARVMQK